VHVDSSLIMKRNDMKTVLLVGAGQIGSRYLQGLRQTSHPLRIVVVDPSRSAREIAAERWNEVIPNGVHATPAFFTNLSGALSSSGSEYDVAIVSTSAGPRRQVITAISESASVQCWILEKVLAQSPADVHAIVSSIGLRSRAFVNTPRRLMKGFEELRRRLIPPLDVHVYGGMWGLASNAVHMIDLVEWLAEDTTCGVSIGHESGNWYATKRHGYFDMTGEIEAVFENGSRLTMNADTAGSSVILNITDSAGNHWSLDEQAGTARGGGRQQIEVLLELQSQMTPLLIDQLLETGSCGLPTLEVSARMHAVVLEALVQHWNESNDANDLLAPVT